MDKKIRTIKSLICYY